MWKYCALQSSKWDYRFWRFQSSWMTVPLQLKLHKVRTTLLRSLVMSVSFLYFWVLFHILNCTYSSDLSPVLEFLRLQFGSEYILQGSWCRVITWDNPPFLGLLPFKELFICDALNWVNEIKFSIDPYSIGIFLSCFDNSESPAEQSLSSQKVSGCLIFTKSCLYRFAVSQDKLNGCWTFP